jgi:triphosphatase
MPVPAGGAPADVEVEWQLDAFDLRPVQRWLAAWARGAGTAVPASLAGLEITPVRAKRLVDIYFDTDDWRIGRAGFVLRLRRRGRRTEATLKDLSPPDDGLRRRLEVTETLAAAGLGGLGVEGPVGRRVSALAGTRRLKQVLEVHTHRRPYELALDGERVAELALDDTAVSNGSERRQLRLQRVELEVVPAFVDAMQPLVEQLRRECGLRPATLSKFEAGMMAAGIRVPGLPDLGPTAVTGASTTGELAYATLRRDAAAMLANEPGTRLGEDIEALHQMRVATRRLRAALALFADALPLRAVRVREELGWLAGQLGVVRDLDIQLGRIGEWQASMAEDSRDAIEELAQLFESHRREGRHALLAALDSRRYERLVDGLVTMLEQGPSRRSVAARTVALSAMPDRIAYAHSKAVRAAKRARRSGLAGDFHALRIRCKRLRYSLEFAAGLYDGEVKKFAKRVAGLQDELGLMNDATVASERLATIATTPDGEALPHATVFLMGGVAERYRAEAESRRKQLTSPVRALKGSEWSHASGVMQRRRAQLEEGRAAAGETAVARLVPRTRAPVVPAEGLAPVSGEPDGAAPVAPDTIAGATAERK